MDTASFIELMKTVEESLQNYINPENEDEESDFSKFSKMIDGNKIREDKNKLIPFLHLLISISKHQHRCKHFFDKIEKILLFLMEDIKKFLTQIEIFDMFKSSKRILLFLVNQKVIIFNQKMVDEIIVKKFRFYRYMEYFYPEIEQFLKDGDKFLVNTHYQKDLEQNFEENRKIGENHHKICQLIRDDKLDDFIVFINETNCSINSEIERSIFETNQLLCITEKITLIEYALFFGSIRIVKYLLLKRVKMPSSAWILAIHSNNAEMINLLEDQKYLPNTSLDCFKESIKCHHLNISRYIQDNYISESDYYHDEEEENGFNTSNITDIGLKNFNFHFIKNTDLYIYPGNYLYYLIKYDYTFIANYFLVNLDIDVDDTFEETKYEFVVEIWMKMDETKKYGSFEKITKKEKKTIYTPLFIAVEKRNAEIVKLILEHDDLEINYLNTYYHDDFSQPIERKVTALYEAVTMDDIDIIKLLLAHEKIDVNILNNDDQFTSEPVLFKAIKTNKIDIVNLLLECKNIDINAYYKKKEYYGGDEDLKCNRTALYAAIEAKNIEIVKLLLSNDKLDINKMSKCNNETENEEENALITEIKFNCPEIVKLILDNDNLKVNVFYNRLKNYYDENYQLIEGAVNIKLSPIYYAVKKSNHEIVKILLNNKKVDVNVLNKEFKNIEWRSEFEDIEETVLHLAVRNDDKEVVQLLAQCENINFDIKDKQGKTPIEYAKSEEIKQMLNH